jgi:hypothetical protein
MILFIVYPIALLLELLDKLSPDMGNEEDEFWDE